MSEYLPRAVDIELDQILPFSPAVALDGPKGVGKTATAARRANTTWFLDDPAQAEIAAADFQLNTVTHLPLLLDEWQNLPQVWNSVRRQVDAGAAPGSYILTGSATPRDAAGTHSGAGRISSIRMRPLALFERNLVTPTVSLGAILNGSQEISGNSEFSLQDYATEIAGSGFPASLQLPEQARRRFIDDYLTRIIDREVADLGTTVRKPELLRRWMASYAAATSLTTSYATLLDATTGGDGMQPAKETTLVYREHLSKLWLLDPVPAWLPAHNTFKRLGQAPKHQLADPALAVRLLGLSAAALLDQRGAHLMGQLFEALATLSVRVAAQVHEARVSHLRLNGGTREIDLIVEGAEGQVVGIEVKLTPSINEADVKHLKWLKATLGEKVSNLVVITTGPQAYRRSDGILIVPLALLGC